jgi:hypothetical protein
LIEELSEHSYLASSLDSADVMISLEKNGNVDNLSSTDWAFFES